MSRIATILVVALALLWQTVALARPGWTVDIPDQSEHTLLHWQDVAHHHHDDGSLHFDDSDDSTRHMLADHSSPASTGYDVPMTIAQQEDGQLRSAVPRTGPQPDPEGLLRPPRTHA